MGELQEQLSEITEIIYTKNSLMSSTLQILEEHFGRHPPTVLILQWHLPRHFIYKREKQLILDSLIQQQQGNLWT